MTESTAPALSLHLEPFLNQTGGLLSALRSIMQWRNHIPREWIPTIADAFNLSQAEVLGVVNFYDDFDTRPAARHELRICEAEACQAAGAWELLSHLEKTHGLTPGQVTADGKLFCKRVACLGLCPCGPALVFDTELHARVSSEQLDNLILKASRSGSDLP